MNRDRIECVARVGAPVERVWPLIADGAGIRRWFAFDGAELDAVPGGAAVFEWAEHGRFLGVVEDVRPERLLTVRWALVPDVAPDPGNATLVEFHLEPDGDQRSRVRIVESGFAALHGSDEERRRYAEENTQGWQAGLSLLTELAEGRSGE